MLQCSNKLCKKKVNERALWSGWILFIDTRDTQKVKNDYGQCCSSGCAAEYWTERSREPIANFHLGEE
jgi:hypothetical protein